jgi:hypothetical protein
LLCFCRPACFCALLAWQVAAITVTRRYCECLLTDPILSLSYLHFCGFCRPARLLTRTPA